MPECSSAARCALGKRELARSAEKLFRSVITPFHRSHLLTHLHQKNKLEYPCYSEAIAMIPEFRSRHDYELVLAQSWNAEALL